MPYLNDVVVRETTSNSSTVYVLGTIASPDQFQCRDRNQAVSLAMAFVQHQHVEGWFQPLDGNLVSLGTFRTAPALDISVLNAAPHRHRVLHRGV